MKDQKITVGVIPAAGAGKRFGYLSNMLPKAMLPLYDRPIIHHVVDQMQNIGIEDIYIVVNVQKEKIIEYFRRIHLDLRANIHFIEQQVLNGTGESILSAEKYVNKPFLVMYGDDCTISDSLPDMTQKFFKSGGVVMQGMIKEVDKDVLRDTCSAKLDKNGKIIDIIEKPENPPYLLRGCGVFIFKPEIFLCIKKTPFEPARKEREIIYTINDLAKNNKAYGYQIDGYNININDYNQLLTASHILKENKMQARKIIEVLF
ncbi:MAG: nucleotidyltransferase family protein [Microgenomates group bacterium]